jgi:GT2 family glycosyltransferase
VARADLLRSVGGWRDFDWSEDWDLWVRAWQAGATIEAIPGAVYIAHVRKDSRNRAPARSAKLASHRAIARANGLPVPA